MIQAKPYLPFWNISGVILKQTLTVTDSMKVADNFNHQLATNRDI